jgi:hypothetical protein
VLRAATANFRIYVDPSVGAATGAITAAVKSLCERDLTTIRGEFGGISPAATPYNVIIAAGVGGAYHYGCAATEIYCGIVTTPAVNPRFTEFVLVAEVVEVFEATQAKGWDCGASNGEGLSRTLATSIYPNQIKVPGFATAKSWLDSARPDYVNTTFTGTTSTPGDADPVANGCSVLFLNYLRHQLGHPWGTIAQAAGTTLAQTYQTLTGNASDPFPAFQALLAT